MRHALVIGSSLFLAFCLRAAEMAYPSDLAKWQEVPVPPKSRQADWIVWFYAANDAKYGWRVLAKAWSGFYPHSSVFLEREQKLYLGMRQFVAEFDLKARKLRLLIPSHQFLNQLPKEEEKRLRKQYGS